jgi:hypothetical protein
MQVNPKIRHAMIAVALVLFAAGSVTAQNRVAVPSTATGGFGDATACHTALVPALTFSSPQTVIIDAAGRVRFGSPSYAVAPSGIAIGENKNFGALVGAFVEQGRAGDAAFQPVNEDLASGGVPSSSLFVIGNGPYKFEAPGPGTLFLGINAGDVCGTSGSFSVSIAIPVDTVVYPGGPIHRDLGGAIQLAILSSSTFDAGKVDPRSLVLMAARVGMLATTGSTSCTAKDVNGDGLSDTVCHFQVTAGALVEGSSPAILEGHTVNGTPIRGMAPVEVVP